MMDMPSDRTVTEAARDSDKLIAATSAVCSITLPASVCFRHPKTPLTGR